MEIPEEVQEKILQEVMEEMRRVSKQDNGKPKTLHELEGTVLEIGKRFEKRLLEEAVNHQIEKSQKKTARDAKVKRKTGDCGTK